jgi:hypothetical protein
MIDAVGFAIGLILVLWSGTERCEPYRSGEHQRRKKCR